MEEEDEFGDLYTDVLCPLTSSAPPPQTSALLPQSSPSPPSCPIDLNLKIHDEEVLPGAAPSRTPAADSSYSIGHGVEPRVSAPLDTKLSRMNPEESKIFVDPEAETPVDTKSVDLMDTDVKFDIEEDGGPAIPGVSDMPRQSNDTDNAGDNWDSDSEDELQIVLNENPQHWPMGLFDDEEDDDEDGDPLVIVTDGVSGQPAEEADRDEDAGDVGHDGERKEAAAAEAVKASGGVAVAPKIGYSSHGYHPFHSQFKYVRPGAAPVPGSSPAGSASTSGQVHPLVNMGPVAGRGRGEWRQAGIKGGPGLQKYPGYGAPPWGSARVYGGGLEFTLPSHKTIFEVDIDSFEEKRWNCPGVDSTDFFNFGLNEESWKDYCKQLEQHRLETTMQSRIRVYESVRTEKEFDPDMPPELAAATGIHDAAVNANTAKSEAGQMDARVPARVRLPLPTGRAIQVENGSGERLPSIDTRPPRIRDSDAIIEIICQDFSDDNSSTAHGVPDQHGTELPSGEAGDHMAEGDNAHEDNENSDTCVVTEDGQGRETVGRRGRAVDSAYYDAAEGDGTLPPRSKASKGQTSPCSNHGIHYEERRTHVRARGRSGDVSPAYSTDDRKSLDDREASVESMGRKRTINESSLGCGEITPVPGDRISEREEEDAALDETPADALEDYGSPSRIKRKTSPQAEEPERELDNGEDSRAGRSRENSKGRSGSSREYPKQHDGLEEEVVQAGLPSRYVSSERLLNRNEQDHQRKCHEMKPEIGRNHLVAKGREDSYREWDQDQNMVHNVPMKSEESDQRKERDTHDRSWQQRDDDPRTRRDRAEDTRKRDRPDEMGSRHRSRACESESEKDEYLHLSARKHVENGMYEANYDSSRLRERDSLRSGRHESAGEFRRKRRREDEHSRRDHPDKEETFSTHKESTSRQKRERGDDRKGDEQPRGRDDIEGRHSNRHKDDASSNRERSEKQKNREGSHKARQAHDEDVKRKREARGSLRSGGEAEDKARVAVGRARDDYKIFDKDHHSKDALRHVEPVRGREHTADEISHQRGCEDTYSPGNQTSFEEKRSRRERSTSRNDQRMHERVHTGRLKKTKESEGGNNNSMVVSMGNQDDQMDHVIEKGGGSRNNSKVTLHHQSLRKRREDASSDDEQSESRRGRSKLERWTSHKEREFPISSRSSPSLKFKELGGKGNGGIPEPSSLPVASRKHVEKSASTQQAAVEKREKTIDAEAKSNAEKKLIDNQHLDTVEKLKKRSERFNLPMPSGKEAAVTKKIENEALSSARTKTPPESETKHERPARKRRWTSS